MSDEETITLQLDLEKEEVEAVLSPRVRDAIPGYIASLPPEQREESKKHLYSFLLKLRQLLDSGVFDHLPELPAEDRLTTLYRFFDKHDQLLYVGITNRGTQRIAKHASVQSWWIKVRKATFTHYENRLGAQLAEAQAIQLEKPRYNKAHPNIDVLKLLIAASGAANDD